MVMILTMSLKMTLKMISTDNIEVDDLVSITEEQLNDKVEDGYEDTL